MRRLLRLGTLDGSGPTPPSPQLIGGALGSYGPGTSWDFPLPGSAEDGDTLVAGFVEYTATTPGTFTAPSGWTLVDEHFEVDGSESLRLVYWTATLSPSLGFTFTRAGGDASCQPWIVAGRDGTWGSPVWSGAVSADATLALPTERPAFLLAQNYDGFPHGTPPAGYTEWISQTLLSVGEAPPGTSASWVGINNANSPWQTLALALT